MLGEPKCAGSSRDWEGCGNREDGECYEVRGHYAGPGSREEGLARPVLHIDLWFVYISSSVISFFLS